MATIATAEVQVIADTSRFVPDLRRKLRAALTGIGADVGNQITAAMRGLGDQISATIEREVRRTMPRVERTIHNLGRDAAENFNDGFKDSITRNGDYDRFFAQLFHGTIAEALEEEAQEAVRAFENEFDLEQAAVRKAIAAADAMDRAFEERFARNFSRYEDIFENEFDLEQAAVRKAIAAADAMDRAFEQRFARNFSRYEDIFENEFDLEQAAFNKAVAAADAMDEAFEQRFAINFEQRGEEAGQALADGIRSQEGRVADAFGDILDGIDARQRQTVLRARQNGGNIALAFSQGVQQGAQQAADDAADALAISFQNSFRNRLQLVFSRVLDLDDLFDSSRPAIQRATDVLRRFGDTLANVARQITIVPLQNLGNLFSDLTTNTASAAAIMLLFLGALDQLAGTLFAVPAALGLVSAAVATVAVGFYGMIEAFDKGEEALNGLPPAAQSVAREFIALDDSFRQLRLDVQEALWSELDGAITAVADNLLGPVREGMTRASGALGRLIRGVTDFLAEAETAETVVAIFDSLTAIFESLSDEVQPFLRGMRTLSNEFLPGLEATERVLDGIGTAFERWATAVTTGDLLSGISPAQRAFQEALQVMEQLWRITLNVASAVGSVFDAARRNGNGFLDLIERISESIAEAFASPEGQDTLMGFLDDLVSIADVVAGVLGTVFEQFPKIAEPLADIAEDIGPDLMDFINELGDAFAVFLEEAGPGFEELASALGELDLQDIANNIGDAFSNVAPFLHEMIELFGDVVEFISIIARTLSFIPRGIAEFARAFVFLQEVFDNIRNIDGILSGIGDFFADFGPRVADGFSDAMESTGEFFSEFGPRVADGFGDAAERAGEIASQIGEGFMELFGPIIDGIVSVASAIGTFFSETLPNLGAQAIAFLVDLGLDIYNGLVNIATDIVEWASGLLDQWTTFWTDLKNSALLTLQTIGLDITGSLDNVSSTFTGITSSISGGWTRFWNSVKTTAQNALNTARSTISNILSSIRSTITGWIDGVRSRWSSFWSGLTGAVSGGLSSARSAVTSGLNAIRDAFNNMAERVRSILNSLRDFISGIFSRIQGIISSISGAISSAISAAQNLGNIDLNPFANGGIVNGPTAALIGEAGREVVIPLTRPQRATELAQQSGLIELLAAQGALGALGGAPATGVTSAPPVEMHVHSGVADPEQVARRAVRILERRMGGRGLERLS
jgi:phage-related protein